ncbi:vWA domain-containing protein [Cellulophaga baltica]|uniref:vWA domain-containing protein n=1 Tax=Cellulophaga baltica TaxID=76594 RepID=UPI0015F74A0E|nr:vWA domain-containing protein [Cellulophaga baltica]MBA6315159.1 VWA domain-containing protein [Cellulophaga baltica]
MDKSNTKQWSSATPGYIIFLVDQSGSMSEPYGEGKTKSEFTALVINRTINELINTNMDGEKVKDRLFISMIGYGGSSSLAVDDIRSDYLSSFADHPIRMESLKKKVSDGAGGLIEINEEMPIFIEPVANGLTPMAEALSFAKELIDGWLTKKPDNPAPVIINISDGLPYTGGKAVDTSKSILVSEEIMKISSMDGNPLLFNCHLGDGGGKVYKFSESENEILDEQAKFLFNISSKVPESYKQAANKQDLKVSPESRGFVSNADPDLFIKFINFGSSGGATDKIA